MTKKEINYQGFNPHHLLGRLITQNLGIPFLDQAILKQAELKENSCFSEYNKAFLINEKLSFKGVSEVFLFKDIFKNGRDLRVCAKLLKQKGVKKVWGLTLALDSKKT